MSISAQTETSMDKQICVQKCLQDYRKWSMHFKSVLY